MKKIVSLIALGKPMEDLGEEIMEEKDIPCLGDIVFLDEGNEGLSIKFKTEDEETNSVKLYGELIQVGQVIRDNNE